MPIQIDLGGGQSKSDPSLKAKPKGPIVGIDLGTTNSLVAYATDGQSKVIRDPLEGGILPSVVALTDSGALEGVGQKAVELKTKRPSHVLFSVKRLMGRSYQDLLAEAHQIPFKLADDELHSQVLIEVGGRKITPVEVSSQILKVLKKRAERELGQSIERAVITVPAYFDDAQRTATKAAGRLAGLEVLRVVNEPTAAALAYGWSSEKPGTVAIFDFGGGTFDVSILRISENVYEVLSTAGDTHLGGDDLDRALSLQALNRLGAEHPEIAPSTDAERQTLLANLLKEAERVKISLTTKESERFFLGEHSIEITRSEADAVWTPFIERALHACARALSDARLDVAQLNDVLLVGGSTRVPLVQRRVEEFFGRAPNISLNPDEAVALGAALQAQVLAGQGADRLLLDVIPLSLGIETMGGAVSKLIHRNSTIPTEAREVYTNHAENQTAFDIHILQGERELVHDCRSLARFKLRGLDPAPPGFHRIEVLFRIDANGILNVRARDLRSGKAHEIEVRPSFGLSEDELLKMLESSIDFAEQDMEARQLLDLRVEADTVVRATEKALVNAGHLVSPAELAEIKARLIDLKNVVGAASSSAIRRSLDELDAVSRDLAEIQVNTALKNALSGQKV